MREISDDQRLQRMRADNPWWEDGKIRRDFEELTERTYCRPFEDLVTRADVRRAVILMGPRRIGKTVLLHHVIRRLLDAGACEPHKIGYVSLDQPLYTGLSIEEASRALRRAGRCDGDLRVLFLDEIQYLPDWERHLKAFVDAHPDTQCVACGSAAAALKRKSAESGAGRFTDFLLPPLTFWEYLFLSGIDRLANPPPDAELRDEDWADLNAHFVDYVNFGGYPEAVTSASVREDPGRYIRSDIVDKVLLRDLPSLYGIRDVQELNRLFAMLAYNTAGEVSLDALSQGSGVSKPTIRRYLDYLEAAFLIRRIHRVDENAKRFRRATHFKIHLTTPSLRTALFGPVDQNDDMFGAMAETALFAQWMHSSTDLYYARWPARSGMKAGEVDLVHVDARQRPNLCVEVKWSDRWAAAPDRLDGLVAFSKRHPDAKVMLTTRTARVGERPWAGSGQITIAPTTAYCYVLGRAAVTVRLALKSPLLRG